MKGFLIFHPLSPVKFQENSHPVFSASITKKLKNLPYPFFTKHGHETNLNDFLRHCEPAGRGNLTFEGIASHPVGARNDNRGKGGSRKSLE
jgi:hypothetical protein